jgi:protein-S-isoprenylcysteine O-methyltransferase Ste14
MTESAMRFIPIATVAVLYAARIAEVLTKRDVIPGKKIETITFKLFMVCGVLTVVGGIAEFIVRRSSLWWPTFIAGLLLSMASFALRRAAIRALGRFWSLHVEMREEHRLVTSGPFAYMRHPAYFSMILELLSVGLILTAWFTLTVSFAIFIPTLIARILIEERGLLEKFGDPYREYRRTTSAVLPSLRKHA